MFSSFFFLDQGTGQHDYCSSITPFIDNYGEETPHTNLCTIKPTSFFHLSISPSYKNSSPQDQNPDISEGQTDHLSLNSSSKILKLEKIDDTTTVQLTDNSKLIPACSLPLYNFPVPYLYAPYIGIYLQDMQHRMKWISENANLHYKSADLSHLPLNHFPAVSLQDMQQWDPTGQPKKPTEARPGFISEIGADAVRETAGKHIHHVNPFQWLLSTQSLSSIGSPDSSASKYPKSTADIHSHGAGPSNSSSASFDSSDSRLTPDVLHPIPPKENPSRYRRLDGISRSPVMKNLAAPPLRAGISAQRSIPSSPHSSPFVKQRSFWPRTQEFLQEVERFDSQARRYPAWDQIGLQKFYYPKFNSDRPPFANTKSTSPSSTATPLSNSSSSRYSGQQVGKASNGEYVFMDFHRITHQDPKIPRAIPAPYSFNDGRGTLDRILDNPQSTTNVYIRGFHPNTTDAMIQQYGSRFGEIETAKSIIDHLTNTCKGYVFFFFFFLSFSTAMHWR